MCKCVCVSVSLCALAPSHVSSHARAHKCAPLRAFSYMLYVSHMRAPMFFSYVCSLIRALSHVCALIRVLSCVCVCPRASSPTITQHCLGPLVGLSFRFGVSLRLPAGQDRLQCFAKLWRGVSFFSLPPGIVGWFGANNSLALPRLQPLCRESR